jgi:hypothetical protein
MHFVKGIVVNLTSSIARRFGSWHGAREVFRRFRKAKVPAISDSKSCLKLVTVICAGVFLSASGADTPAEDRFIGGSTCARPGRSQRRRKPRCDAPPLPEVCRGTMEYTDARRNRAILRRIALHDGFIALQWGIPSLVGTNPEANANALKEAGINSRYYVSPQTAHEWQNWRRSLHEFAPLLFQD